MITDKKKWIYGRKKINLVQKRKKIRKVLESRKNHENENGKHGNEKFVLNNN